MHPDLVALLGDEQYQVGTPTDFAQSFDQAYGGFKFLERPSPGNHEYYPYVKSGGENEPAQNGNGYFGYFNGRDMAGAVRPQGQAGSDTGSTQGWYSYNLGDWHVISLNAECNSDAFGHNCNPTQGVLAQETTWLAADLAANSAECTVAYWHQPTFTATGATSPGDNRFASAEGQAGDAWWQLLYQHHADLVLNGHEHVYARFKPQDASGNVDTKRGITQFTVGTGGESLDTLAPSSKVVTAQDGAFGVLKLSLGHKGYSWNYTPVLTKAGVTITNPTYTDIGSGSCHG
jgi:hypothetical protein